MELMSCQTDQATTLRMLADPATGEKGVLLQQLAEARRKSGPRVIAVTSGKGGVGKSTVVVNLAITMARLGQRVLVIDADLGVGNLDVLLGLKPNATLDHLLAGEKGLAEIIITGPAGIKLIPAGSGVQEYTSLDLLQRLRLMDELDSLEEEFDLLIIDTEAGLSENVTYFNASAQEIIVVVKPEPTSLTDVYALIKLLATRYGEDHFKVLVNMARDEKDAEEVFTRLAAVTSRFLDISLDYLGYVLQDPLVVAAIKRQKAVVQLYPDSIGARCFTPLARRILADGGSQRVKGTMQFCFRRQFPAAVGMESI